MVCEVVEKEEPKIVAEDIIQDIIKQAILRVEKKLNKMPPQVQTGDELCSNKIFSRQKSLLYEEHP